MIEKTKYRKFVTHIPTIMRLKGIGKSYRFLETTFGMSAAGIHWMLKHNVPDFDKRCPTCLKKHGKK